MIIFSDEFTGNIGNEITGFFFGKKFLKGHGIISRFLFIFRKYYIKILCEYKLLLIIFMTVMQEIYLKFLCSLGSPGHPTAGFIDLYLTY